jgi:response regulator RpfG family c-di-GMP phosphodiesterase
MDRLLFVDDEPFVLKALKRTFEMEGFDVVVAARPSEALAVLKEGKEFQVIGSDYRMPEMNGAEFLQRARELSPQSYRLLISAVEEFGVAVEAVNRGEIHRLIPKPWDRDELIAIVRSAAEDYHLRRRYQEMTALLHAKNAALEAMNRDLEQRVRDSTAGLLAALAQSLDSRRAHSNHSRLTAARARRLGVEMGLAGPELTTLEQAGLLHNIGLAALSDAVLQKPGPLTPEEKVLMRRHCEEGYRMLAAVPFLREVRKLVLLHHERWDGGGYPLGLSGSQIPLLARILHVAETYSAMREDRAYRPGCTEAEARAEVLRAAGTQFDPAAVEAFSNIPAAEWESPALQLSSEALALVDPPIDELRRRAVTGTL